MRIATLMINGLRHKLPELLGWMENRQPDLLALQKTFMCDDDFPKGAFGGIGYRSLSFRARSSEYNPGVAILIREKGRFEQGEIVTGLPCPDVTGSRFLSVDLDGVHFASVYAPYLDYLKKAEAIRRRVGWLRRLHDHAMNLARTGSPVILCGDFNVKIDGLPERETAKFSEDERRELIAWRKSGLVDLYREAHTLHDDPGYTFGFSSTCPEGTSRLHLAIASQSLARHLVRAYVDTRAEIRKEARPLVVEFAEPVR